MSLITSKTLILALMMTLAAAFAFTACGDDDDDDNDATDEGDDDDDVDVDDDADDDEDPAVEACEHMTEGPFEDLTATVDTAGAPAVDNDHTAYRVAFTDVTGGLGGFTSFSASEEGDYYFFLSLDVPFSLFGSDGVSTVEIESSSAVDACEAVAVLHVAELGVGEAYLFFGPTDMTNQVTVVIEFGEHEHDE